MEHVYDNNITQLGEGIIWNHLIDKVQWVDIENKKLYSKDDHTVSIYDIIDKPTSIGLLDTTKILLSTEYGMSVFDFRINENQCFFKITIPSSAHKNLQLTSILKVNLLFPFWTY